MKIVISNDDSLKSEAIHAIANELKSVAEIIVVAPEEQQSGVGQAFTFFTALNVSEKKGFDYQCWGVEGTPSDAVKFALLNICGKNDLPDLVISGPNDGENSGVAVFYSGTVAAAREAALWGVPAISLSLHKENPESLELVKKWILNFVKNQMHKEMTTGVVWNVNFPDVAENKIKGTIITRMSTTMFKDEYELRDQSNGIQKFQLIGYKPKELFVEGSDDFHHYQHNITITPLRLDQTDEDEMKILEDKANILTNFEE